MVKPFGVWCLLIIVSCWMVGCSDNQNQLKENSKDTVGDKPYIFDGYKDKLKSMGLTEVAAFPYFHSPFIAVAKDKNEQQLAVIFYEDGKTKNVKLVKTYEEIVKIIEEKGFKIKASGNSSNLHLFEIKQNLFWNYEDGEGHIYLDNRGQTVADPYSD